MAAWRTERSLDLGAVDALPPRSDVIAHVRARTRTVASAPGAELNTLLYAARVSIAECAGRVVATYDIDVAATARAAAITLVPLALVAGAHCSLADFARYCVIGGTFWLGTLVFAHAAARSAVRRHLRRSIKAARKEQAACLPAARTVRRR